MPYFKTGQEWMEQSALLIEARPKTTRITTRYSLAPAPTPKSSGDAPADTQKAAARAELVLKTFDPVSGVTLKYRTTKAQEVTRLMQTSLGTLGRGMAGLPALPAETAPEATGTATPVGDAKDGAAPAAPVGGKKKKKGKK
ncbi:hypothetical protein VHEMI01510 [[Torrubiella] hemipterigena]|uniref:SRP9 domain-containing protein n=1 Tax=[Torrubiella] hemipterigena TaxID=1531966 RepID=A0A0A1ST88_9HYPO|nr:hypothetical protein VHEMI01510 [[Torrubiella] hemipterigena]